MRGENKLLKALDSMFVDEVSSDGVALLRTQFLLLDTPRNQWHLSEAVGLLMEQLRTGREPQPQ